MNIDGCVTEETGKIFEYTRGGNTTLGVIMGEGPVGVVVSYERRGKRVRLAPAGRPAGRRGTPGPLFDRNNTAAPEEDTVAMAERLRKEGVTKVVLVGGSMGGRLSAARGRELDFPVAGVVSVSGAIRPGEVAGPQGALPPGRPGTRRPTPRSKWCGRPQRGREVGRPPAGRPPRLRPRQQALHRRSGSEGAQRRHVFRREAQGLSSTRLSW